MIPGGLLSAFPHRQFHTLPGLLDSWAALPNSYPNALRAMQGGSLYHFYDGLWYDPAERRTHDLPCERRTRYLKEGEPAKPLIPAFPKNWYLYVIYIMLHCNQQSTKINFTVPLNNHVSIQRFSLCVGYLRRYSSFCENVTSKLFCLCHQSKTM